MIDLQSIIKAHNRIKPYIENTPILVNQQLNQKIGAQVFFKCENHQKTLSFKARGAFNALLAYQEKHGFLPKKVVAQSSGNHAQALAYACKLFGIEALIYMAKNVSPLKAKAASNLGAQVVLCEKRSQANQLAQQKIGEGYFFIHPSDNDDVIAGQGTAAFESINEIGRVDAVFVPCGGAGLAAGTYISVSNLCDNTKVYACEPLQANDAARSLRLGKIVGYEDSPDTIADGARSLMVSERCFAYLKQSAGVIEILEEEIIFWQKEFLFATGVLIEPTSALAVAGAARYCKNKIDVVDSFRDEKVDDDFAVEKNGTANGGLSAKFSAERSSLDSPRLDNDNQYQKQKLLVIISGGNI